MNTANHYDKIFTRVPARMILDPRIDGYDLAIYSYISISCYYGLSVNHKYLVPHEIYYQLWDPPVDQYKATHILNSIKNLIKYDYLTLDPSSKSNQTFLIKVQPLFEFGAEEKFQLVHLSLLDFFKTYGNERDGFNLLKLYLLIMVKRNIRHKNKWMTQCGQEELCDCIGVSKKTLGLRIKKLEEIKKIFIIRNLDSETRNIYASYEDQETALDYVKWQNVRANGQANRKRSLMMKYNAYVNKGVRYSDEELLEICCAVIKNNKDYDKEEKDNIDGAPLRKKRDLSVFPDYIIEEAMEGEVE